MNVDTEKALKIVEANFRKSFVSYPYEREIINSDRANWLGNLATEINSGDFAPGTCSIAEVPKGKGAVRPGSILTIKDAVAYTSVLDVIFPLIHHEIEWSQGVKDFAYKLVEEPQVGLWFQQAYVGWEEFRSKSLELMEEGTAYVVTTDITGFYENIDHTILISDLRQIGVNSEVLSVVSGFLRAWSHTGTKGIPQATSASHLLAKLYLNPIDRELSDLGYRHTRYSDDFRIFCKSYIEAKKVLVVLSGLLRQRGLNLQSAKSSIERVDLIRPDIEGAVTIIQDIADEVDRLDVTFIDISDDWGVYDEPFDPTRQQLETIKQAFSSYFIFAKDDTFNKSLFHYLLNQLGAASEDFAANYCLSQLERHPEEMKEILKYFSRIGRSDHINSSLIDFLKSEIAIYDYQNYQIIEWLLARYQSEDLLAISRAGAFDGNKPSYYRAICIKILGEFGSATDLNRILRTYPTASSALEECAIICSLRRLERGRRNAFISREERKSAEHRLAGLLSRN